jgi:hypothetical protein
MEYQIEVGGVAGKGAGFLWPDYKERFHRGFLQSTQQVLRI